MYYNDDFRSSDQYRYTNRDQLPHDDYAPGPNRAPAPAPESPKKQGFFHRTAVKVTALILACAVAGGLAGWGGAAGFVLGVLPAVWYDRRVRRRPPVYRIVELAE